MDLNDLPKSKGANKIGPKPLNNGWEKKEHMNPETGLVTRSYSYKGKKCTRVPLDSRLADQLAGYSLIDKDLRSCINWLNLIEETYQKNYPQNKGNFTISPNREEFNVVKGLYVAMITFYGKCFASCEGRKVKLERNQLIEEFRPLHDTCIEHRNNFAAHSGAAKIEECKIALVHTPIRGYGKPVAFEIFSELQQPDALLTRGGDQSEKMLHELFEHARQIVKKKSDLLVNKIKDEEVLPKIFPGDKGDRFISQLS